MATMSIHFRSAMAATLVVFSFSNISHAAGTPEQRQACAQDALRFCSSEVPNVPRITACMDRNFKNLSPLCRAQFKTAQYYRSVRKLKKPAEDK